MRLYRGTEHVELPLVALCMALYTECTDCVALYTGDAEHVELALGALCVALYKEGTKCVALFTEIVWHFH